jgi:hypothetical protein
VSLNRKDKVLSYSEREGSEASFCTPLSKIKKVHKVKEGKVFFGIEYVEVEAENIKV